MSYLSTVFTGSKVKAEPVQYASPGFNAGGLSAEFKGGTLGGPGSYVVTPDANRTGLVSDISSNFRSLGDLTGGLRATVAPGFNDLLKSRLNTLNDSATSAIGDLKQNLQARRVLGSSFGTDTISRANAEFGRQRDAVVADNFLKSLEANNNLLKQQYDAYNQQFQAGLSEMNLEASIANGLTTTAAQVLAANAQTTAKLQEDASKENVKNNIALAAGLGQFFGLNSGGFGGLTKQGGLGVPNAFTSQSAMGGGAGGAIFA